MKNRYIFLICSIMLLSGCATQEWPSQPSGTSIGRTYTQLVEAKRLDQQVKERGASTGLVNNFAYDCFSCNGQPTRTYSNPAGSIVAAYLYGRGGDSFHPPYSNCTLLEERYELRNDVVVDEWYLLAETERMPLYTKNVCAGYDHIDAPDPPLGPHRPDWGWNRYEQRPTRSVPAR
jgi:hypothetical protein